MEASYIRISLEVFAFFMPRVALKTDVRGLMTDK